MDRPAYCSSVPVKESRITGEFWQGFMNLIRTSVIPYQWEALNDRIPDAAPSYSMHNFRVASGKIPGTHNGCVFQDSDVAKWIEAAAFTLMWQPDPELEKTVDSAVDEIVAAQQPDGYLNTYYIINGLNKRFTNLMDNHELYCLGHFLEAAVAYYEATGKDKLLKAMTAYADLVGRVFGREPHQLQGYPGHEEIELSLVKLYQITHEKRHLDLAKYFIDQRGQQPLYFEEELKKNRRKSHWEGSAVGDVYYQSHLPVRDQYVAVGHAVRAVYLYTGMAEVARETDDPTLAVACQRLWNDITQRQMYITGAIGSSDFGESFTYDYDLPNGTVYAETCASIGLAFFANSMLKIRPCSEYADVIERTLYNGILSGMSYDGKSFFYVNPLEAVPEASEKNQLKRHIKIQRQKWFGCACCPPNVARLLSSLSGYIYGKRGDTLFIHQYIEGKLRTALDSGEILLEMKTGYPWDEAVNITVAGVPEKKMTIAMRIPGWCGAYKLFINEEEQRAPIEDGYLYAEGSFKKGDEIRLVFEMPVTLVQANPKVREDIGKLAVTRGPVVYCLEEVDNGDELHQVALDIKTDFRHKYDPDFFGGAVIIKADGKKLESWDAKTLYAPAKEPSYRKLGLTFIPYYLWANREPGEMTVWVHNS